jgi:hypothetical protein
LIKNGANIRNSDKKQVTPMGQAKRFNKQQIMDLFVKYGIPAPNVKAKNKKVPKEPV